jgi:hypothetical protein
MKRSGNKIAFEAENTARGAQLRITTQDAEALTAIYSHALAKPNNCCN